jgi:hypothetical protein
MKIQRLETHDRLLHFKKDQSLNIAQGAEDCLRKNKLSLALQEKSPYVYLFAHPRTHEDGVTKVMYWQPRLSRPEAQTNSYLFRAISKTDLLEVCWLLPPQEMWSQYKEGKVTADPNVIWSIEQFIHNKEALERPLDDDLPDCRSQEIYHKIIAEMNEERLFRGAFKQETLEPCQETFYPTD